MARTPEAIIEKIEKLKGERGTWENHWQELTDYMLPNKAVVTVEQTAGDKMNTQLYDSTGQRSAELLAGALHGMLTNPYSKWFDLVTGDPELDRKDNVRAWLQDTATKMQNVLNDSNFQTEVHEYYIDLVVIGTAPLMMEEDEEEVVRFMSLFIKNIFICENSKGVVDEIYRKFEWSARHIVDYFGMDNLPKKVLDAYAKDQSQKFCIAHAIYPKSDSSEAGSLSAFKFISHYVLVEDRADLSVKGFNELPIITGRWAKTSDEEYGRSPGMTALPECKTINQMTEDALIASAKLIDPPLQMPDDGFILPAKTFPGAQNFYRSGGQERIESIYNKEIRIDLSDAIMEKIRARIREAFYTDQLQVQLGDRATTAEVQQKTNENFRFLGPMLGRQQNEFLGPLIKRLYGIMSRKKLLKTPPPEIKSFGVKYSSSIARLQREAEGEVIMKTVQAISPFIQVAPEILDNINADATFMEIASIYGLPQRMIKDKSDVDKLREDKKKAQQQMMQQQLQMNQADQLNKIAPLTKGNQ